MQSKIEYSIVALGLSTTEVAGIVKDATGLTVDPKATNFLQPLNQPQLETIWKRLSNDSHWRKETSREKARSAGMS